jgi:HlyD family secretion protein
MSRGYVLPLLAILGLGIALATIVKDNRQASAGAPPLEPAGAPYASSVAGAGLVEARTGNTAIGSPVSGIAAEIDVHVGQHVEAGDPLFRIDDRDLQAQLPVARARVKATEAALREPRHRLDHLAHLARTAPDSVSTEALSDLRDELAVAETNVEVAKAQVTQLAMDIERRTVRAPVAGRVLQLKLRLGEYVDSGGAAPLLLFGDDRRLYVRVDVDENEASRIRPGAPAVAFMRGGPKTQIPLQFEYIEPDIIPKKSLTGRSTERTDTRVLQVLYSFTRGQLPVYVGQQLDVFIEAAPAGH